MTNRVKYVDAIIERAQQAQAQQEGGNRFATVECELPPIPPMPPLPPD